MVVEQFKRYSLERTSGRRDLIEDVDAVLILFDHSLETADLTLNSSQPPKNGDLFIDVPGRRHKKALSSSPAYPMGV